MSNFTKKTSRTQYFFKSGGIFIYNSFILQISAGWNLGII